MAGSDRCSKAMSCGGGGEIACAWDGGRKGCSLWCQAHAKEWAPGLLDIISKAQDPSSPMSLVVDMLTSPADMACPYSKGTYLRAADDAQVRSKLFQQVDSDFVSEGSLSCSSLVVSVCGLLGNPPPEVLDEWENQFTHADILDDIAFEGYAKRITTLAKVDTERWTVDQDKIRVIKTRAEAESIMVNALSPSVSVSGIKLIFQFSITISGIQDELASIRQCLDYQESQAIIKAASGSLSRYYLFQRPASVAQGGIHVSLCRATDKPVCNWHSFGYMLMHVEDSIFVDLTMLW
jgi:hypothetical protein